MAAITKQHNFNWDEDANPDEVNTNFNDLFTMVNTGVIHKDGTVDFTVVPAGPAVDPTNANQFCRKSYVDAKAAALALAEAKTRPKLVGVAGGVFVPSSLPAVATTQYTMQAGSGTIFLNGNKEATITFPVAFATGVLTVVATEGAKAAEVGASSLNLDNFSKTGFRVTFPSYGITAHSINWIAIGW